jgi:hypothetical protein
VVRHNFEVASGYYSIASLKRQLNELVGTM